MGASVGFAFGVVAAGHVGLSAWQAAIHEAARYTLVGGASGLIAALLFWTSGSAVPARRLSAVGAALVSVWALAVAMSTERVARRLEGLVGSQFEWSVALLAGLVLLVLLARVVARVLSASPAGPTALEAFSVALIAAFGVELALAPPEEWRPQGRTAWLVRLLLVAVLAGIGCLLAVRASSWLRRRAGTGRVVLQLRRAAWTVFALAAVYGVTLRPRGEPGDRASVVTGARGQLVTVGDVVLGTLPPAGRHEITLPAGGAGRVDLGWGLGDGAQGGSARFSARLRGGGGEPWTLLEEVVSRSASGGGSFSSRTLDLPSERQSDTLLLEVDGAGQGAFWVPPLFHGRRGTTGAPQRPSVILVSLDTVRADHLNAYGYKARATSPEFDAWAREGTLFESAMSAAPGTLSSQMSLLTGRYPSSHGVSYSNWRATGAIPQLGSSVVTLADVLQRAGFATAAFTGSGYFALPVGYAHGFTRFVSTNDESLGRAPNVFRKAFAWLEAHREDPFFLFIHTYEAHEPYLDERFVRQESLDCRDWRACNVARYDGDIRRADESLGALRARLAQLGLADRTLVIVASDHGEEFGDHFALWNDGHGHSLFDELVHVPLLVAGPSVPPGRRVAEVVDLTSVAPTVLAYVGLEGPPGMGRESLLAALKGAPVHPQEPGGLGLTEDTWIGPSMRAVRAGPLKLIVDRRGLAERFLDNAGRRTLWQALQVLSFPMLFDLQQDPGERENRASWKAGDVRRLRRLLDERLAYTSAASQGGQIAVQGEALERLKSLGYVE